MKMIKLFQVVIIFSLLHSDAWSQDSLSHRNVGIYYFEEVVNKQRLDLLSNVFPNSYISHSLTDNTKELRTFAKQKDWLSYLFKAFPDLKYTIGDVLVDKDKVVMRVVLSGTQKGEFLGYKPSGRRIDYLSEIFFFRVENNKIAEAWVQIDWHNLFKNLNPTK
jgi:predicted ester cyclase